MPSKKTAKAARRGHDGGSPRASRNAGGSGRPFIKSTAAAQHNRELAVYAGRDLLGTIVIAGKEFRAVSPAGALIGVFASQAAAAAVLGVAIDADQIARAKMRKIARKRSGRCYELSYILLLDLGAPAILLHGSITDMPGGDNWIRHAWLEMGGNVYDAVLNKAMPVAQYVALRRARLVTSAYSIVKHWLVPPSLIWIDKRHITGNAVRALVDPYFGSVIGRLLRNYIRFIINQIPSDLWRATAGIEVWTGVTTVTTLELTRSSIPQALLDAKNSAIAEFLSAGAGEVVGFVARTNLEHNLVGVGLGHNARIRRVRKIKRLQYHVSNGCELARKGWHQICDNGCWRHCKHRNRKERCRRVHKQDEELRQLKRHAYRHRSD
jgi:hypothetical protein